MDVLQHFAFILGASIPLILLLGSVVSLTGAPEKLWRNAHIAGFMALIASTLLSALSLYQGAAGAFYDFVHITPVSVIILLAITLIAFVVLRFSENYMSGEPNQQKFAGLLQLTFAASTLVIISNHLLVLMAAWMTVSLAMHQLLLFYPERPRAALVMTTRVSIKVRLAWSTSAQMSLMLIECALGLYELALLHLVGHSFYKAHAFLNSGNAVNQNILARSAIESPPKLGDWLFASVFGIAIVAGIAYLASQLIQFNWYLSPWLLLTCALIMLLAQRNSSHHSLNILSCVMLAVLVTGLYIGLKSTSHLFIGPSQHAYSIWADAWVSVVFISLLVGGYLQRYQLKRIWVQKMNLALFSGLYIDEWSTRTTLAIWPKLLPVRMNAKEMKSFKKESLS